MSTWLLLLLIAVYLIPTWVSLYLNGWGRTSGFVYWVNLLLGWTVVAWFLALQIGLKADEPYKNP